MNDIKQLFFNLTPTTLAAIAADLDGMTPMWRSWIAALDAGFDNAGDEFNDMLAEARAGRNGNGQRDEDESGYNDTVAAGLTQFTQ